MANGYWGGRLPIANIICSRAVVGMMKYGLARRRLINRLKKILSPRTVTLLNSTAARDELRNWMDRGYDKLNIGGGSKQLDSFVNIDFVAKPGVERQVVANILDLSFVPDACVSQVHTNHVVEHLTGEELRIQLRQWHRILKPGGRVTLRCPNALGGAYGFWFEPVIETGKADFVALGFPQDEDFGNPKDRWVHKDLFGLVHWFYGDVGNIENQHLSILTPKNLMSLLTEAHFELLKVAESEAMNIVIVAQKQG